MTVYGKVFLLSRGTVVETIETRINRCYNKKSDPAIESLSFYEGMMVIPARDIV